MANASKKNEDAPSSVGNKGIDKDIKNLSFIIKLAKFKKSTLVKANFSKTDFFTFGAKKAFIYLQKAFIEAPILRHFDPKGHIKI